MFRILSLPPVEERKMSQGWLRRTFLPPRFTLYSDDTYIYYQCARTSFYITGILLFLNWVSLIWQVNFDFHFFEIDLPKKDFIVAFAHSFPFYTATILLCTVVPFYLVKLLYNVNPKKVDVTWWYTNVTYRTKGKRYKMVPLFLFMFLVTTVGAYIAFGAPLFLMSYSAFGDLGSSYPFYLLTNLLYWLFYSGIPMYAVLSVAVLRRYIGPYTGELSSKSIQGGKQQ
jgi:hypothetical protein